MESLYPVERHITGILEDIVVWMSHERDVPIPRGPLWAKIHHHLLRVLTVAGEGCRYLRSLQRSDLAILYRGETNLLVHDDVDLHSCFCFPLQNLIQAPFLVVVRRSAQELVVLVWNIIK